MKYACVVFQTSFNGTIYQDNISLLRFEIFVTQFLFLVIQQNECGSWPATNSAPSFVADQWWVNLEYTHLRY
jgi:hypothetical protein